MFFVLYRSVVPGCSTGVTLVFRGIPQVFRVMFSCSATVPGCSAVPPVFRVPVFVVFIVCLACLQASEKQNIYRNHNPNFCFEHSGGSVREKILKSSQNKIHFLQIRSCVKVFSCLVQWDLTSVVKFESNVALKIYFQFAAELDFFVVKKLTSKSMK